MRFVEAFLVFCLLSDSPLFDATSLDATGQNQKDVAKSGRDPELQLIRSGSSVGLREWAIEIIDNVRLVAEVIDRGSGHSDYVDAVDAQAELVRDSDATPSARILQELKETGTGFYEFAFATTTGHKKYFRQLEELAPERLTLFEREAVNSTQRQKEIEAADSISFDEYLANYFASG